LVGFKNSQNPDDVDPGFIESICQSTWKTIYRFIYYRVQNREDAKELTQETYVKAIRFMQTKNVRPEKQIPFLKTVALNLMRDQWRKQKLRGKNIGIDAINPSEAAVADSSERSARRLVIEQALDQLKKEERMVVELRILKGYSVAETAEILNKQEGNIRVIQHRALQKLAEILKPKTESWGEADG